MFLLDTNLVSELRKAGTGKADQLVVQWARSVEASQLFLSAISIFEIELGVSLMERRDVAQGQLLRGWLDHQVLPSFAGRILAIDSNVAQCAARLHVPNPRSERDCLIAATAIVRQLTVVTRNISDFRAIPVKVFNPWTD